MSLGKLDDLEQFRLLVEQLEVCRDLVLQNVPLKSRMALILLDNVAEVILYRASRKALEYDSFVCRVVPPRFSLKQREAMERYFEAKLNIAISDREIDAASVEMLRVLHRYRNGVVHRDTHNPIVIPILARLAFLAVSRLFANTHGGISTSGASCAKPIDWLVSYDLIATYIDYRLAAEKIALHLQTGIEMPLQEIWQQLSDDLLDRISQIRQALSQELPLANDVGLIDQVLKLFEFRDKYPNLEFKLSERYRSLHYKIAGGRGEEVTRNEYLTVEREFRKKYDAQLNAYESKLTYEQLANIEQSIAVLRQASTLNGILTAYAKIDKIVTLYERSVYAALLSYDEQLQMEIDISRGK